MEPKESRTNSPTGAYLDPPSGSARAVEVSAASRSGSAFTGVSTMEAWLQRNGPGTDVSPPYSR